LGRSQSDDINVVYDVTPPALALFTQTIPTSPSLDNFPKILGTTETNTAVHLLRTRRAPWV